MRNSVYILFLVLITISSFSQKLDKLGKIEIDEIPQMPDYRIEKVNGIYKVVTDCFNFEGNSYYKISKGFITSLEIVDKQKDYIKHYDSKGKLLASIYSDRIINLKISKNGNRLVFNNSENIIQINLNNYDIDTLNGSYVYSFVENDDLIYYNSEKKLICSKGIQIPIDEYPSQLIEFKGKIIIIAKQNMFELVGNSLNPIYEFEGKFFDAKVIDHEFYFVDKLEKRKSESFTLYKTSDFKKIMIVDKLDELNR